MNVQVNTDNHIEGSAELIRYVQNNFNDQFARYKNAITRIEVHLSDENASKTGGDDKRCLLEARIANRQPIVVSHHADNIHQAIEAASDKLLRALDNMAGRLTDHTSPKELLISETSESDEDHFE